MSTPATKYKFTLYSYFRSSCSARVRIAAHLKSIPLEYKYISLLKSQQNESGYTAINPSESVPTLIVTDAATGQTVAVITQSVAIIEFLEDLDLLSAATNPRPDLVILVPPANEVFARAKVRDLVNIIACDIQPVTNLHVTRKIQAELTHKSSTSDDDKSKPVDTLFWMQHFMRRGLNTYEKAISDRNADQNRFSYGNHVTIADLALYPAVDNALRYKIDVEKEFPRIWRVYQECGAIPAFQQGSWRAQGDTPEEFRRKDGQ